MTLEEIQRAIEGLSHEDQQELVRWIDEKDIEWDDEHDRDSPEGKIITRTVIPDH